MKSLPNKYFGPSGLPCLFTIDDAGNTAVGYFLKQLGTFKFLAYNGSVTKIVSLAQNLDAVTSTTTMPVGTCTIQVMLQDQSIENIRHITSTRCLTVQGNGYQWHDADPTETIAGIVTPSLGQTYYRLLENGSRWLLETGGNWLTEQAPPYWLLEDGGIWLLETRGFIELDG